MTSAHYMSFSLAALNQCLYCVAAVLHQGLVASCEFLVNISFIYGGAILLIDLYTIVLLSCLIMSFTVFQPRFWISGLLEASKLLLVISGHVTF